MTLCASSWGSSLSGTLLKGGGSCTLSTHWNKKDTYLIKRFFKTQIKSHKKRDWGLQAGIKWADTQTASWGRSHFARPRLMKSTTKSMCLWNCQGNKENFVRPRLIIREMPFYLNKTVYVRPRLKNCSNKTGCFSTLLGHTVNFERPRLKFAFLNQNFWIRLILLQNFQIQPRGQNVTKTVSWGQSKNYVSLIRSLKQVKPGWCDCPHTEKIAPSPCIPHTDNIAQKLQQKGWNLAAVYTDNNVGGEMANYEVTWEYSEFN